MVTVKILGGSKNNFIYFRVRSVGLLVSPIEITSDFTHPSQTDETYVHKIITSLQMDIDKSKR